MQILKETSRTFGEYLIMPNLTGPECTPDRVDLSTPLVRHRVGKPSPLRIATPLVSAIMEAVSSPRLATALADCGGRYAHTDAAPAENLLFEEGVDGIVPYAGTLSATVSVTLAKIKATLVSCGSSTLPEFHDTATLIEISHQSWMQNGEDVQLRNRPTSTNH